MNAFAAEGTVGVGIVVAVGGCDEPPDPDPDPDPAHALSSNRIEHESDTTRRPTIRENPEARERDTSWRWADIGYLFARTQRGNGDNVVERSGRKRHGHS